MTASDGNHGDSYARSIPWTPSLPRRTMADYFINALVTLFVTLDPVGLAPVFLVLTAGHERAPSAGRSPSAPR